MRPELQIHTASGSIHYDFVVKTDVILECLHIKPLLIIMRHRYYINPTLQKDTTIINYQIAKQTTLALYTTNLGIKNRY